MDEIRSQHHVIREAAIISAACSDENSIIRTGQTYKNSVISAVNISNGNVRLSFLPRDARSAKRGVAIVSLRLSVCLSVTLRYRGHIGWTS